MDLQRSLGASCQYFARHWVGSPRDPYDFRWICSVLLEPLASILRGAEWDPPGIPRISNGFAASSWSFLPVFSAAMGGIPPGSLRFPKDLHSSPVASCRYYPCRWVGSPGIFTISEGFAPFTWSFLPAFPALLDGILPRKLKIHWDPYGFPPGIPHE